MKLAVKASMGAFGLALTMAVTGCDDGRVGIIPDDPPPTSSETTTPSATPTTTTSPPTTSVPPVVVPPVGAVPGNPAAAPALTAWATDLASKGASALTATCWTMPPATVAARYADVPAILAAVATPGVDGQYAVTWTANGTSVAAKRSEIASGYACPFVFPQGQANMFSPDDAAYAVVRFLSRAVGRPVNPRDVETFYPLICPGNSPWDPEGVGATGQPPLKLDPNQLSGIRDLDAAAATTTALRGDYVSVTIPITDASGTTRTAQAVLSIGPEGYCLGSIA